MPRIPHRFLMGAAAASLALTSLAFSACGGDSKKVDVDEWVDDFCNAGLDFTEASDEIFADADSIDLTDDDAKDEVVQLFEDQKEALADFRKEFDGIGTPDIDGGDDVVKAAKANFDDREKYLDDFIKAVKKLKTGDDFEDELNDVADDLDEPDSFLTRLEDVDSNDVDDLVETLEENEDCAFSID